MKNSDPLTIYEVLDWHLSIPECSNDRERFLAVITLAGSVCRLVFEKQILHLLSLFLGHSRRRRLPRSERSKGKHQMFFCKFCFEVARKKNTIWPQVHEECLKEIRTLVNRLYFMEVNLWSQSTIFWIVTYCTSGGLNISQLLGTNNTARKDVNISQHFIEWIEENHFGIFHLILDATMSTLGRPRNDWCAGYTWNWWRNCKFWRAMVFIFW